MKRILLLTSIYLLFALITIAQAATITWDGGGNGTTWTDANNWDTNTVPGSGDDVVLSTAATITLGSSTSIQSLAITSSSVSLTISSSITLTIDGGTIGIDMDAGTLDNNGTITISNTSDDGVNAEGDLTFNNNAGASLMITNAGDYSIILNDDSGDIPTLNNRGIISTTGGVNDGLGMFDGPTFNNFDTGQLTITDAGDFGIRIFRGNPIFNNDGIVTITNSADDGIYSDSDATFNNNTGSTLNVDQAKDFGILFDGNPTASTLNNDGTINVTSPSDDGFRFNRFSTISNTANGIINVSDGVDVGIALDRAGRLNNSGTITISNCVRFGLDVFVRSSSASDLSRFDNIGGIINLNGNSENGTGEGGYGMRASDFAIINNSGQINGVDNENGEILVEGSNVSFSNAGAIFAPGASTGNYTIDGDFTFGSAALNMEIDGVIADILYDQVNVTGTTDISGTILNIEWGSFVPEAGDMFTILTAGALSGAFTLGTNSNPDIVFTATYSATSVILTVTEILPVELVRFSAEQSGNQVYLDWQTASEINNKGFNIERSADGKNWEMIGFVAGKGSTNTAQSYAFEDKNPYIGINYYRLRQTDFDEQFEYSDVVSVSFYELSKLSSLTLYPTPTQGIINLQFTEGLSEAMTIRIFNPNGQLIEQLQYDLLESDTTEISVATLPTGTYFLQMQTENVHEVLRFVKQ
ncbi:MAG: T9SS type A sorting domain-containing protein [Bacteroidota bacterium]